MVRKHLKLYLFLLVTAVITFFLFGEQLLRTQMPDSKPPLIRIPLNKINYTAHQYEIKAAQPIFQIRGNVVGTVLKSADRAKPKILGLANKLIEGLNVKGSSDQLTLAVFDMFGVFQDLESNMVEDEKRIKLLIYPMKKSYDPCLVLTKDEWKSSGWQKLLNSRLLSLYTADFIHEIKKSFGDNQGTYLHLLYNDIDLKDDWNEMLPLEEAKATISNSDNHIAGFVIPPSDLEEIESSIRQNALSGSSVKDTLLEEIDGPSSTVDIVKGAVTEDVLLVPIDRDFHDCETHVPIPWPLPSFIQHNKANRDTRVIIPETLAFLVEEDLTLPKWFYDALGIQFQQILTVQSIPQAENEDLNALPKLSYIAFNINNDKDTIPYGDNEEYIISMSANNYTIDITAPSMVGALRAIQSLGQLVRQGRGYNYIPNFPITIKDRPKFPHRGLLMDTAREYYNTSTIKSIIQFLGANKMNVLHWHITDDHAFSIESKKYPGLAKGSTFGGPFYTQEEVKEIVDLAKLHGVRVIAEIGGPAHAGSWINEHHRDMIANCPKFSCKKAWGVTMNPTLDKTYNMLQDFFNEISALFPDPYMHFGGDEATPECWSQDANVVSWMKANDMKTDYNKLMQHFETKFHDIASSIKRIGMRWEEVWSRPGSKLDWPIVVAWISKPTEGWMTPLIRDYNVSFLSYNGWYLNHNAGGVGCQTWSECYDTKIFELDPNSKLWSRALGGCASAWEMSDAHFTGRDLWLRTSTLSEPLWTAESVVAENRQQKNQKVLPRLLEMCRYLMSTQFSSEVYKTRHPCWHLSQDYLGAKHQEIKNQLLKEYSIREAQRDDLICTRVKNHFNPSDKTSLTCSTKNCIRENIGTTHHETKG